MFLYYFYLKFEKNQKLKQLIKFYRLKISNNLIDGKGLIQLSGSRL